MFVVIVAVDVAGRFFTVHEVVVEGNLHGANAMRQELYGEAFAGSSLSTRRRACDEYHTNPFPMGYLVGDTGNLLLL